MAINFDSLPTGKPVSLPEPGRYYATIDSAEMKQGLDTTKPPYLNLAMSIKDSTGKSCGKIYDILSESDKELVQFKLARFLISLGLTKLGVFELVDLVKVVKGKQLIVDIKIEEAKDGRPARAVVDVFSGSIYYPMSEARELFGNSTPANKSLDATEPNVTYDDLVINAEDAADVHVSVDDEF
jgi:hypothetical protein